MPPVGVRVMYAKRLLNENWCSFSIVDWGAISCDMAFVIDLTERVQLSWILMPHLRRIADQTCETRL